MNTPTKTKCDRTPTKAICDRTPTPRTDEEWAAWPYAGPGISVHFGRELERELAAVTEQRDRLAEALMQMWPFVEEDDYPNCNTPAFNAAILKYKQAIQSLTTKDHE
jgi:hypothetical protein